MIAAFALNADFYLNEVVGSINALQEGLSRVLGHDASVGVLGQLDTTMEKSFELLRKCLEKAAEADWTDIGSIILWYSVAIIVMASSVIVTLIGGTIVLTATLLLKIMFAVGPLFIMCLMFPPTARFFDNWFAQVMNYTLKIVLIAITIAFANEIFNRIIMAVDFDGDGNAAMMAIQLFIASYLLYRVLLEVGGVASALAGGVSMSVLSLGQLAAAALAPASLMTRTGAAVRNVIDPVTTRRDLQSGMMTTARRSNHLVAGNTALNPAYRQHIIKNIGRNWGHAQGGSVKSSK